MFGIHIIQGNIAFANSAERVMVTKNYFETYHE